jgi:tetratricopeptide (TPR) repeat protein
MVKKRLLNPLSAVRDFLDYGSDFGAGIEVPSRHLSEINDRFMAAFPDIRSGKAFIGLAMAAMKSVPKFGAVAIRTPFSEDNGEDKNEEKAIERLFKAGEIIDPLVQNKKGLWGPLDPFTLACFFPGKDRNICEATAAQMRYDLSALGKAGVFMGVADYPCQGFLRGQVLDNARKAMEEALLSGPGSIVTFNAVSLNISGDEMYEKGEIDWAVEEFKMALVMDPLNLNVINSLGVCYGVLGLHEKALAEFKKAIEIDPSQVMPVYNAGFVSACLGSHDQAFGYFRRAGEIGENVFEVSFQTGKLLLEMGNPQKACEHFEQAAQIRPENAPTAFYLGECRVAAGMPEEAELCYKKAVKNNPNDALSLSALGHLYETSGKNLEIAEMFCRESVKLVPENGLFRHRLGRIHFKRKRFPQALAEFKKAGELGHDSRADIEKIKGAGHG